MEDILGVSKVGVVMNAKCEFLCWNNDKAEFYLSKDVKNAQHVLGDKELNYNRLLKLAKKSEKEFFLVIGDYMYCKDDSKSGFVNLEREIAVRYEYINK